MQSAFYPGDYVLVHKNRWPQRKISKLESQWLGPYRVHEVHHNSLKVFASPTLGGLVDVSLSQVKRWSSIHGEEEDLDEVEPEIEIQVEQEELPPVEEKSFPQLYNVEKVLQHK